MKNKQIFKTFLDRLEILKIYLINQLGNVVKKSFESKDLMSMWTDYNLSEKSLFFVTGQ